MIIHPYGGGKVSRISKAAHVINEENPAGFNDLLIEFASDVFK
jgi:hypothetical protein